MLLELEPPWVVVGNMHGYYDQLLRLFKRCGDLPDTRYLFLGGYVDKGRRSLDTIVLLLLRKTQYPDDIVLLRSNHEEASMTRIYGFYDECKRRANVKLWKCFMEAFNCMPACALIREKIFCVCGGLSPELTHFDQIRQLTRPTVVPDSGLLCDLVWSDPHAESGWVENDRGVSYCFGPDVVQKFVESMGVDLIVRSHQVAIDGYVPWKVYLRCIWGCFWESFLALMGGVAEKHGPSTAFYRSRDPKSARQTRRKKP